MLRTHLSSRSGLGIAVLFTAAAISASCSPADPSSGADGGMAGASGGISAVSGGSPNRGGNTNGLGGASGGAAASAGTGGSANSSGGANALGGNSSSGANSGGTATGNGGGANTGGNVTLSGGSAGAATAGAGGSNGGLDGRGGSSDRGGTANTAGRGGAGGTAGAAGGGAGGMESAPPVGKKFVGNIDTRGQIRSDFVKYWNQFSAENAGKWGSVERTRDQMNWSPIDTMYAYAKAHNIIFKQHNFVWGQQQPTWLNGLSESEQREEVEEWIRLYCERYPDTPLIDVVNEPPPHTTPPYVAALGGAGSSGYDWIAQAFKWAHQYCPKAILILNDYNNIEYAQDNSHTIDIVNKIKAAGAPINAVGAQAHDAYKMSTSTVQGYIDKIARETGLPVYISEYDVDIADDNQQKSVMQSQFTMFYTDDNVKGITLWGYITGNTWKANTGIMSSSGTMRPAMTWLLDYLGIKK